MRINMWVAGNLHVPYLSASEMSHYKALYKSTYTLLYFDVYALLKAVDKWQQHCWSVPTFWKHETDINKPKMNVLLPSVLWHCKLRIRKSIWPVKNWVTRCWYGCLSGRDADDCIWPSWRHCHPIICSFIKIQNGLTCGASLAGWC